MIQNANEFEAEYGKALNNAIDYVMGKILSEYKSIIDAVVYDAYSPMIYDRTYDFKESWQTDIKHSGNNVEGVLEQNTALMSFNPDKFQHGDNYIGDLRKHIADMIFKGYGYFFKGDFDRPRDAWSPLLELVNDKLDNWFTEGMTMQGINIKKNTVGGQAKSW